MQLCQFGPKYPMCEIHLQKQYFAWKPRHGCVILTFVVVTSVFKAYLKHVSTSWGHVFMFRSLLWSYLSHIFRFFMHIWGSARTKSGRKPLKKSKDRAVRACTASNNVITQFRTIDAQKSARRTNKHVEFDEISCFRPNYHDFGHFGSKTDRRHRNISNGASKTRVTHCTQQW